METVAENKIYGVQGVVDLYPEGEVEQGVARLSTFEFKDEHNPLYNLRNIFDGGGMFRVHDGHYVRLHVNGELMMSDTGMERQSNKGFIYAANGRVLIAGLGVGLIIRAILDKPEVTEVVVVEKYQDVIDLVAHRFEHPKFKVICADIFDFTIPKEEKYDTIYFDIWPQITEDNLPEIAKLHNKFKNRVNRSNPKHYMNSWMKEYLRNQRARESRSRWW